MFTRVVTLIAFTTAAAVALVSGPSGAGAQSPGPDPVAATEWVTQPYLHVEYQAQNRATGGAELTGYVYNDNGQPASNVWLEITELGSSGEPMGQITRRVDDLIPAKGRAYFDVRVPVSASYRVVPQAGEFVEGFGGNGG
jgi:hypothetical protein